MKSTTVENVRIQYISSLSNSIKLDITADAINFQMVFTDVKKLSNSLAGIRKEYISPSYSVFSVFSQSDGGQQTKGESYNSIVKRINRYVHNEITTELETALKELYEFFNP